MIVMHIYCYNAKCQYLTTILIIYLYFVYLFGLLAMFVGSDEWCFFGFIITTGDSVGWMGWSLSGSLTAYPRNGVLEIGNWHHLTST